MKSTSQIPAPVVADADALHVAIVVSEYHESITGSLTQGAQETLVEMGISDDHVTVINVPGAFELPVVARRAAETDRFDAIVCLGCVIRGETPHFDYIASSVAAGLTTASQATGVPISFGVLMTNSYDEAAARAGAGSGNKGREAAMAAVRVAQTIRDLG